MNTTEDESEVIVLALRGSSPVPVFGRVLSLEEDPTLTYFYAFKPID
jgi:hypothetical protein